MNAQATLALSMMNFLREENPHLLDILIHPLVGELSRPNADPALGKALGIILDFVSKLEPMPFVPLDVIQSTAEFAEHDRREFQRRESEAIQKSEDQQVMGWLKQMVIHAGLAQAVLKNNEDVLIRTKNILYVIASCLRQSKNT